jgi:hypothetical protein
VCGGGGLHGGIYVGCAGVWHAACDLAGGGLEVVEVLAAEGGLGLAVDEVVDGVHGANVGRMRESLMGIFLG